MGWNMDDLLYLFLDIFNGRPRTNRNRALLIVSLADISYKEFEIRSAV